MGKINVIVEGPGRTDIVTSGRRGPSGPEGRSAYQVWLDQGNVGTEQDFIRSLSGGSYTHNQMVPSNVWYITHGLEFYPNVISFDTAGTQILGEIRHVSANSITIEFSHPSAGKAYLS